MGAAALNDAAAWCLLVLAISLGKQRTTYVTFIHMHLPITGAYKLIQHTFLLATFEFIRG